MSYAVKNDGQGWRAVSASADVCDDEWYCTDTPPEPIQLPSAPEEMLMAAKARRDQLLASATNRMGPLQDAIDEGVATPEEVARLRLWKQYRIALNRIEHQDGFPATVLWPVVPE